MHRDTFTHRCFYTKKKKEVTTYRCFVQRCFCSHKKRHVGIFTQPLPQRSLHRTIFTHIFFLAQKNIDIEKIVHTECAKKNTHHFFCKQTLYPEQLLHSRNSSAQKPLRPDFFKMHSNFSRQMVLTQKVLRTEGFMHNIFYIQTLYTQMPLHGRRIAHRNLCTQHTFTRNQLLHGEFCFPFFITYLSRSPLKLYFCNAAQALCVGTWEVLSIRAECRRCEGSSAK